MGILQVIGQAADTLQTMTLVDYLQTPAGVELVHAVIVLLTAIAAWFTWSTHSVAHDNRRSLRSHIREHQLESMLELERRAQEIASKRE